VAGSAAIADAATCRIPTNLGNGADAEIRESNPTQRRGNNGEIASRIKDEIDAATEAITGATSDRSSMFYTRIDTSQMALSEVQTATDVMLQLTYRNNNLSQGRVEQTIDPDGTPGTGDEVTKRAGLNYWALNLGHNGNGWIEDEGDPNGISYSNAPGLAPDDNIGTIDIDPNQMTFLGQQDLPDVDPQNWHPVGGELNFSSAALTQFVQDAKSAGQDDITFAVSVSHDGDPDFNNLINFNYLFNPKDMVTLNDDPNYDPDTTDGVDAPGSPFSGADNSAGAFSPALIVTGPDVIPEPTTAVLFGLGAMGMTLIRRRK